MTQPEWRKASHSKYKHLYDGRVARCGSPATPLPYWHWAHTEFWPRCPKCLKLMTVQTISACDEPDARCVVDAVGLPVFRETGGPPRYRQPRCFTMT